MQMEQRCIMQSPQDYKKNYPKRAFSHQIIIKMMNIFVQWYCIIEQKEKVSILIRKSILTLYFKLKYEIKLTFIYKAISSVHKNKKEH